MFARYRAEEPEVTTADKYNIVTSRTGGGAPERFEGTWDGVFAGLLAWLQDYLADEGEHDDRSSTVTLTFETDLGHQRRAEVLEMFRSSIAPQYVVDEIGYSAEISFADAFSEYYVGSYKFRINNMADGPHEIGVWTDERTFTYARICWDLNGLDCWASVFHWQPASMTSGFYGTMIAALGPGAILLARYEDEEGTWYSIVAAPTDPVLLAETLVECFSDAFDFDSSGLLALWALGHPANGRGSGIRLAELARAMYPEEHHNDDEYVDEYEVSDFIFSPPEHAREALLALTAPSETKRPGLLKLLERLTHE